MTKNETGSRTPAEIKNVRTSVSMLSKMTKQCIALNKNAPDTDLRSLKDLVAVVNTLNPLVMQHFGQGAAELTLRYEDLEIEKESI